MTVKVVNDFGILLNLAYELAQAEKSGDKDKITKATAKHSAYQAVWLKTGSVNLKVCRNDFLNPKLPTVGEE